MPDINGDPVAFFNKSNGAAIRRFRRDMADAGPLGAAAETAVGDQGHALAKTHADNGRGRGEHLRHAGPALGAAVADDHHIPFLDLAAQNSGLGLVLGFDPPGRAAVLEHLFGHRRLFDHATVRGQISVEHGNTAEGMICFLHGPDDVGIPHLNMFQIFTQGLAGNGHDLQIQARLGVEQFAHHRRYPAGLVQLLQAVRPAGDQAAEMGHPLAHLIEQGEGQIHPRLPGNGGHMEHRIGGAAQGHVDGHGVFKGRTGGDIPGADVLGQQVHHRHARLLGKADAGGSHRRYGAVARQPKADGLGETVHRIGGEHPGTGTAAGAGVVFEFGQFFQAHGLTLHPADPFENTDQMHVLAAETAGEHGTAAHHDGRDIDPQHGHEHARRHLVAVGNHHQGVKGMGHGHDLHRIGNDLAAGQGILHALVVHGQAIADPDGPEGDGGASGDADPGFHRFQNLVKMDMTGDDLVVGVRNADQGPADLLVGIAHGLEQGTMRRPLHPFAYCITAHLFHSRFPSISLDFSYLHQRGKY